MHIGRSNLDLVLCVCENKLKNDGAVVRGAKAYARAKRRVFSLTFQSGQANGRKRKRERERERETSVGLGLQCVSMVKPTSAAVLGLSAGLEIMYCILNRNDPLFTPPVDCESPAITDLGFLSPCYCRYILTEIKRKKKRGLKKALLLPDPCYNQACYKWFPL